MIDYGTIFLLWSYFGISVEEIVKDEEKVKETVIEKAVARAYRDASSHVLSVVDEHKDDLKALAMECIMKFISELAKVAIDKPRRAMNEKRVKFDELHKKTCHMLVEIYDCEKYYKVDKRGKMHKFTYGTAQKWVNMSLKYIYLLEEVLWGGFRISWISYFATDFHIPFDSLIFKAMEDEFSIDVNKYLEGQTWSQIDNYEKYKELQDMIRNEVSQKNNFPIEWENPAWIRAARKKQG